MSRNGVSYAAAEFFRTQYIGTVPGQIFRVNNSVLYAFIKCHIDTGEEPLSEDTKGSCEFLREVIKRLDPK